MVSNVFHNLAATKLPSAILSDLGDTESIVSDFVKRRDNPISIVSASLAERNVRLLCNRAVFNSKALGRTYPSSAARELQLVLDNIAASAIATILYCRSRIASYAKAVLDRWNTSNRLFDRAVGLLAEIETGIIAAPRVRRRLDRTITLEAAE